MSDGTQLFLLNYLGKHYTSIKQRLTRKLGNAEDAGDALHDTWLRLKGSEAHGPIQNPGAYLSRMAINIAVDVQRRHSRLLSGDNIDALLEEWWIRRPARPGPPRYARTSMACSSFLIGCPSAVGPSRCSCMRKA